MNWPILLGVIIALVALTALLYWQLDLAEGVYLGSRVVIWLYDRFAPRYDAIKQFSVRDEAWFLGRPLAEMLQGVTTSLVLDVATGTARLPLALLREPTFTGHIVALDLSRHMLRRAAAKTAAHQDRLTLLWQDATRLPFPDEVFDAVTCVEALEFLPDFHTTLTEMVRVLRPSGLFLITNRVGPSARWLPGRTMKRKDLAARLESLALTDVRINVWQVDYDIVWARKRSADLTRPVVQHPRVLSRTLPQLLRCPNCCSTPLIRQNRGLHCHPCDSYYPIADDGVVEMASQIRLSAGQGVGS